MVQYTQNVLCQMNRPEFVDGKLQPADTTNIVIQHLVVYYVVQTFSGLCAPGPGVWELSDGKGPRMWRV